MAVAVSPLEESDSGGVVWHRAKRPVSLRRSRPNLARKNRATSAAISINLAFSAPAMDSSRPLDRTGCDRCRPALRRHRVGRRYAQPRRRSDLGRSQTGRAA
jgi:hypothetical protein